MKRSSARELPAGSWTGRLVVGVAVAVVTVALAAMPASAATRKVTKYEPNVTRDDIKQSGGTCAGDLCTDRNGNLWNCKGGGRCSRVEK